MSHAALKADEQARVEAYLASDRNRHLPELVRRWIAEGEGANADEFIAIEVCNPERRDYTHSGPAWYCECCGKENLRTRALVHVHIAESDTCHPTRETIPTCRECAEEWAKGGDAIEAEKPSVKKALVHLHSARSQFVESDDAVIREHVEAAIRLLEAAS